MKGRGDARVREWAVLVVLFGVASAVFAVAGLPSPYLFAGVVAGAVVTLTSRRDVTLPNVGRRAGMTVIGVAAGSMLDAGLLRTLAAQPVLLLSGVLLTVVVTMGIGQLLRLSPHVTASTAVFASIAGGASGVSAAAREVGADEVIVLAVQYFRVLFILLTLPLVSTLLGASGGEQADQSTGDWSGVAFTVVALVAGFAVSSVVHFAASGLVVPLVISAVLAAVGVFPSTQTPEPVLAVGYGLIGVMVGLSFTRATLRQLVLLMPLVLVQVVLSVAVCAVIGFVFADIAGISMLDGYLATTPGGLPAVTAVAVGSATNVGLIIAMQLIRVFIALLMLPVLGRIVRGRNEGGGSGASTGESQ
ncbi:AbrB family transcriptional regulator [Prauserella rugosa]|uniref:AbrB family transcriptional regulator n=1 Tax=Prauserella rugosa TaxID=43354 RepID=UPI00146FD415|nr:AbrB family transcriptional regulator [Prauserella rugosa]